MWNKFALRIYRKWLRHYFNSIVMDNILLIIGLFFVITRRKRLRCVFDLSCFRANRSFHPVWPGLGGVWKKHY